MLYFLALRMFRELATRLEALQQLGGGPGSRARMLVLQARAQYQSGAAPSGNSAWEILVAALIPADTAHGQVDSPHIAFKLCFEA